MKKNNSTGEADIKLTARLLKYDILFQIRQGFYGVYVLLTAMFIMVLFSLPVSARPGVTAYILLSDTSIIGLTFVGALVLLEKQQNTLQSLFITPVKLSSYLYSKVISLSLISLIVGILIAVIPGGATHNLIPTCIAVVLTSMLFTFVGLGLSARVNTVNQYLGWVIFGGIFLCTPLVLYFFIPDLSLVFPVNAAVDLLLPAESQTPKEIIGDAAVLVCWNLLGYRFASQQFLSYIIHK